MSDPPAKGFPLGRCSIFMSGRCRTLSAADATSRQEDFKVLSIHEPSLRGCKTVLLPALLQEEPSPTPGAERWHERKKKYQVQMKFFFSPSMSVNKSF